MKSLAHLWKSLAVEFAGMCCTSVSRDIKTVTRRIAHEGDSFLTITLPSFGKDFERGLEIGFIDSSLFVGFQRRGGPLPLFLGGFLSQVFDSTTGAILTDPSIDSIFAIRQLSAVMGKIERECSDARVSRTIAGYVKTDQEVAKLANRITSDDWLSFRRVAGLLFDDVFTTLDRKIYDGDVNGKHGPGSTADRLLGNEKFDVAEWTQRLEEVFPYGEHVLPNWRFRDQLDHVHFRDPGSERPVRVITVPKTLKTPRIIAIEPTCMQFMQQAILGPMVEALESDFSVFTGKSNHIQGLLGFQDQDPNQAMARQGSRDGSLATLDLSEASDRVSMLHVVNLMRGHRNLRDAVFATRSTKAAVPGWGVISLHKFASMGSALCFPIEAMVFLTTVFVGIEKAQGRQLTRKGITSFRGHVRVYGDDIIVPTGTVHHVAEALETFGFKINASKSFWNGKFRESCGGDFYDGWRVTPSRLKRDLPQSRDDVQGVISLVSFRNQLYEHGLWKTCEELDRFILVLLEGKFPPIYADSSLLGRLTFLPGVEVNTQRLDRDTHSPVVRGWVPRSSAPESFVSGVGALRKCLDPLKGKPFDDPLHLERQGRPDAVGMKLRWAGPGFSRAQI